MKRACRADPQHTGWRTSPGMQRECGTGSSVLEHGRRARARCSNKKRAHSDCSPWTQPSPAGSLLSSPAETVSPCPVSRLKPPNPSHSFLNTQCHPNLLPGSQAESPESHEEKGQRQDAPRAGPAQRSHCGSVQRHPVSRDRCHGVFLHVLMP